MEKRPCGTAEDLYEERENVPELLMKRNYSEDVDKTVRSFLIHALLCETGGAQKRYRAGACKTDRRSGTEHQTGRKIMPAL